MNSSKDSRLVTLLTDFGTEDGYVGAMKGVMWREIPDLQVVDISHDIEPFNFRQAAFSLLNYAFYFPAGTIHLVVVDPGVGTHREALVVAASRYYFIGPNNGVFSYIYQTAKYQGFKIRENLFGPAVSPTFHGRDIFAPAVTRLLRGNPIESFADPFDQLISFYESYEDLGNNQLRLKIIHVDHFGNLILNFTHTDWEDLGSPTEVKMQIDHSFIQGIKRTFAEVTQDQLLMNWDSRGFLQVAQNCGNASLTLNKKVGDHLNLNLELS